MKAEAHLEVYRPFQGKLLEHPRAPIALWRAGLRTAFRRRLALMILLAPPVIGTVIFSFVVYTGYALQEGTTPQALGGDSLLGQMAGSMMRDHAAKALDVKNQIALFHLSMSAFSLLLVAWYGAGLIADDKREGAHLLLFARPLTRTGYLIGRFLTVATFGAFGAIVPTLVVCTIATFASPEWSFVRQEGMVIVKAVLYGLAWVVAMSSLVLSISSLATRKAFALAGTVGLVFGLAATGGVLVGLLKVRAWNALGPHVAWAQIANNVFEVEEPSRRSWDMSWNYISVVSLFVVSWLVLIWRVRRMEAVA